MKQALCIASLSGLAMAAGCANTQPNTFTFTADLPRDFAYQAAVYYVPAPSETCTVETRYNKAPVFNRSGVRHTNPIPKSLFAEPVWVARW